ncbi:MAG TPA: LysR substrate-binding domain-containing protein [Burkholderiaceae bacterium]|nr:LysR substrate-binding domain-containing protein [Burkholderiaceae bacterium]
MRSRASLASLRVFESVARLGGVTRAAQELSVTPGAVSQQIRHLEDALQVELFMRQYRRLVLTDGGRHLARRLEVSFAEIDRAVHDVAGDPGLRRLRLKVTPTFAIRWLVPRLAGFYREHADFELEVGTYPREEDALVEEIDFVVRHGNGRWSDADSQPIFDDALLPVCSPAIARLLKQPSDLAGQTLLHSMMRTGGWDLWLAAQGLQDLRPHRSTRLANAAVTYQAAIDGLGVALAQQEYVRDDLDAGKLVAPFQQVLRTGDGYHLVWARRKANQSNHRLFRRWIATIAPAPERAAPAADRAQDAAGQAADRSRGRPRRSPGPVTARGRSASSTPG